ncbi:KPN_02809 family neutral zinc metallopeptidase [Sediminibacterium soli]|uniref:KPN_02809 family neutral zinc metallopeptidase n=1 Tax=Sediminibacterium soli TaxID=2698829 RepID=UPI00137A84F4|nr:neutral zinc metallopeptidase [Sediminibacterium soli]NCI47867.1 metalloprotease [Sediminibacterium soli]
MRWQGRRESDNVDDRRGIGGGGIIAGGGIGAVIIGILYLLLGGNPSDLPTQTLQPQQQVSAPRSPEEERLASFSKVVLADTEDVWEQVFKENGGHYSQPTMVLFTQQTQSGCGFSSAATGPFYCPSDERIYLDLSFFDELSRRFKAPGEFAMAYVIAHEVGHHIQKLMGTYDELEQQRSALSEKEYNKLSVKAELQADFYAGVWANRAQKMKQLLESGDIESALTAANAIGDDRLQMQSQGYVVPDAFTHGTSQQRMYWFKKGFETGDVKQGNTFVSER